MLLTLALAGIEHAINHALTQNDTATARLTPLIGKTLQVVLLKPHLHVNVVFGEQHIRFEPVADDIFEPQGGYSPSIHGCLTLADVGDCHAFITLPLHDIAPLYEGDTQVLADIHHLCHCIDLTMFFEQLHSLSHTVSEAVRPLLSAFHQHQRS